ncbi:Golgi SNAP receptor complex member 1 isoform X1 [Halyomorpha halys]|uniref:Golgi SNAP receptor complex member 1 isoform X1 n=2 Tax=Halyomorpha halys TaxID=286706 RepID=UPI0006D4D756|nr:Golgi SNAP receptor complex member 1 isoform X1 [Halyomorpha halys]
MTDVYQGLTRKARSLESEIDEKLNDFSKLCKMHKHQSKYSRSSDSALLNDDVVLTESTEIRRLIDELGEINDELGDVMLSFGFDEVQTHTRQIHRERLMHYKTELKGFLDHYHFDKEKEELFSRQYETQRSSLNRRLELNLEEHEHLLSSERLIDDQINIAVETRENLISQRLTMKRLQVRLHDIANRFPVVNSLVNRINLHKRRDSIIIGVVIFICTILLLSYAFH